MSFSKPELVSILEIIELLQGCNNAENLQDVIKTIEKLLSADYGIIGYGELEGISVSRVCGIFCGTYPQDWLQIYKDRNFHLIDPVVKYHTKFSAITDWHKIFKTYTDTSSSRIISLAHEFGLREGISCSFFTPEHGNIIGVMSFISRGTRFKKHHKKLLSQLAPFLYNKSLQVLNAQGGLQHGCDYTRDGGMLL